MHLGPQGDEFARSEKPSLAACRSVVRMLLDHGAIVDENVTTAAREAGDEEIISMLEEKFDESAITDDDEVGSMLGNLFD